MATATVTNGTAYLTNGSVSGDTVTFTGSEVAVRVAIGDKGAEFDYTNELIEVKRPKSQPPSKGGTDKPQTSFRDMLRLRRVITIKGYLSEQSGTTAKAKRDDFDTLIKFGGAVTVVWGSGANQQKYTAGFLKAKVTEGVGRVIEGGDVTIDNASPDKHFFVDAQFLVGEDL